MKKIIIFLFIALQAGLLLAQTVEPLIITDNWRSHQWPYNAYYPLCNNPSHNHGIVNGHVACSCGPTAVSRILHYWEFPVQGNGSFSYTDIYGCQYSANFGETIYEWDKMPYVLYETDPEEVYGPTATLTYHVATCVNDVNVTGATVEMWITGLTSYLCYSTTAQYVERANYTLNEWINMFKNELENGRPILVTGNNPSDGGHWFICDGYNDVDEFHFLMGWGGNGDGYYDIDNPNGYSLNNKAMIGLQPELNGKELALLSPNGGETFTHGEETDITWNSVNVSNIKIEYTTDNGYNWQEIIASTSTSTGFYTWTVPDSNSNQCKVKLTDVDDINVYDKSDEVFSILTYGLTLVSPNGGEYILQGSTTSIVWENTLVTDIKIEYSVDNGSNWIEITASTSTASGSYDWIVPNVISDLCKVKITDITNGTIYDESDNVFAIIEENILGGPYLVDENTILLLSFEGNLTNQSSLSGDGIPHGPLISYETHSIPELSQCLRMENFYIPGVPSWESYLTVPHNENLSLTGDWTIEAWIKMTEETPNYSIVLCKPGNDDYWHSNYTLARNMAWQMVCGYYSPNTNSSVGISSEDGLIQLYNWYHIAFIRDTSDRSLKMLVHNQSRELIAEVTGNYTPEQDIPATSDQDLFIGKMINEHFFFLDGYIDEVRISNVARIYYPILDADFSANVTSGLVPLTVDFTDLSNQGTYPITTWEWDFENDGTINSYEQNPEWIYEEAGIYSVSLTISDGSNTDTEIKEEYINASETGVEIETIPIETKLVGNFPNPFNPTTPISFSLNTENTENTELIIFNLKGQKVKSLINQNMEAGQHSVIWDGNDENGKAISSGIYFYQLKAGKDFSQTKRMLLLK